MPQFPFDADGFGTRSPTSPSATTRMCYVRIVVLNTDDGTWCERCGLPSAATVTYVVEAGKSMPPGLCRLAYCETCDDG